MPTRPLVAAIAAAFASLLAVTPTQADTPATPSTVALHCGHLVDTVAGKLLGATTIVTVGRRIKSVQPGRIARICVNTAMLP